MRKNWLEYESNRDISGCLVDERRPDKHTCRFGANGDEYNATAKQYSAYRIRGYNQYRTYSSRFCDDRCDRRTTRRIHSATTPSPTPASLSTQPSISTYFVTKTIFNLKINYKFFRLEKREEQNIDSDHIGEGESRIRELQTVERRKVEMHAERRKCKNGREWSDGCVRRRNIILQNE